MSTSLEDAGLAELYKEIRRSQDKEFNDHVGKITPFMGGFEPTYDQLMWAEKISERFDILPDWKYATRYRRVGDISLRAFLWRRDDVPWLVSLTAASPNVLDLRIAIYDIAWGQWFVHWHPTTQEIADKLKLKPRFSGRVDRLLLDHIRDFGAPDTFAMRLKGELHT